MHELVGETMGQAYDLFEGFPHDRLFLQDGLSRAEGNLFAPSGDNPKTALLRNRERQVSFLVGEVDLEFAVNTSPLLNTTEWGPCVSLPSDDWADELKKQDDCFYFDGPMLTFSSLTEPDEPDIEDVVRLGERHVEQIKPQGWESPAEFVRQSIGFGVAAEDKLLSYAISNFTLSDSMEVAVWTSPDHHRNGLAYRSASALLEFCRTENIAPLWTSWSGNTAACGLARKLGFTKEVAHDWAFVKPKKHT